MSHSINNLVSFPIPVAELTEIINNEGSLASSYARGKDYQGHDVQEGDPGYDDNSYFYKELARLLSEAAQDCVIDSITEQASQEDEGINTITITYHDGTIHNFTVKNGSKGSKGDTGSTGATGNGIDEITYAYMVTTTQVAPQPGDTHWQSTVPSMTSTNKYLWQKTQVIYTASAQPLPEISLIAIYGDTGLPAGFGTVRVRSTQTVSPSTPASVSVEASGQDTAMNFTFDFEIPKGDPGNGDVNGPSSVTDEHIVLFDGTTGKIIKDSTKSLQDIYDYVDTAITNAITNAIAGSY